MKLFLTILYTLLSLFLFAQKQLVIDENAVPRQLSESFNSIKISSGIDVYLAKGDKEALAVSAKNDNNINGIKTEILNGVMHIFYAGPRGEYAGNQQLKVYVAYLNLEQLQVSGASNVIIAGIMELPLLNIQMSGASDIKGQLNIKELTVKLSGASDAKFSGTVQNLTIENSGASDFKSFDLVAKNCYIKSSGASDVSLTVTGEVSVTASGASSFRYKGKPQITFQQASGASNITKVD